MTASAEWKTSVPADIPEEDKDGKSVKNKNGG